MVAASLDSKAALNLSRVNWGRESKPAGGMGTDFSGRVVPSLRGGFALRIGGADFSGSILLGKLSARDGAFATSLSGYLNDSGVLSVKFAANRDSIRGRNWSRVLCPSQLYLLPCAS